jgi:hypothetical protein
VSSRHTPIQPNRSAFEGEELAAYDRVVARQKGYDYDAFAQIVPEEHRAAFVAAAMEAAGDEADPQDKVQPYMGAMLNSPVVMDHVSELGAFLRRRGETGTSYSHADREWVDMVLSEELQCWGVYYGHLWDAAAQGIRPEALTALREGRDEDLTHEELAKAKYIRQVARGTVTSESYEKLVELVGRRGAMELTAFIGFLILTIRLIQAFGAMNDFPEAFVDDLISRIADGTVALPDSSARIPNAELEPA